MHSGLEERMVQYEPVAYLLGFDRCISKFIGKADLRDQSVSKGFGMKIP